jgi:hypothetical protein
MPTTTYNWPGANGAAWPATWIATINTGATAFADTQSGEGRLSTNLTLGGGFNDWIDERTTETYQKFDTGAIPCRFGTEGLLSIAYHINNGWSGTYPQDGWVLDLSVLAKTAVLRSVVAAFATTRATFSAGSLSAIGIGVQFYVRIRVVANGANFDHKVKLWYTSAASEPGGVGSDTNWTVTVLNSSDVPAAGNFGLALNQDGTNQNDTIFFGAFTITSFDTVQVSGASSGKTTTVGTPRIRLQMSGASVGRTTVTANKFRTFPRNQISAAENGKTTTNLSAIVARRRLSGASLGKTATPSQYLSGFDLIETLTDDFNDNTYDAAKWNKTAGAVETGGQLVITPVSNSGTYEVYASVANYDLQNSAIYVKVVQTAESAGGAGSVYTGFHLYPRTGDSTLDIDVIKAAGSSTGNLRIRLKNNGVYDPTIITIPYDPTQHIWWRVRYAGPNSIVIETSPSGTVWTTQVTYNPTWEVYAVVALFGAASAGGAATGLTPAIFEDVNIPEFYVPVNGASLGKTITSSPTLNVRQRFSGVSLGKTTVTADKFRTFPRNQVVGASLGKTVTSSPLSGARRKFSGASVGSTTTAIDHFNLRSRLVGASAGKTTTALVRIAVRQKLLGKSAGRTYTFLSFAVAPAPIFIAYTRSQIVDQLKGDSRRLRFRYELLDADNNFKYELSNAKEEGTIISASVAHSSLADIKRTAKFKIKDLGYGIDFLNDRIRPIVDVLMPNGLWVPLSQGVFLLSSPTRSSDGEIVYREIEAYDQGVVLNEDKFEGRFTAAKDAVVFDLILDVLESSGIDPATAIIERTTDYTMPTTREWDPGTKKLTVINNLLDIINFKSLYFEDVSPVLAPYIAPSNRSANHQYKNDDKSVLFPDFSQELDLFSVPNKWVSVVSQPDRPVLISSYTNSNGNSPTSTVNRRRTIVDARTDSDAIDQATLDAQVKRIAFQASQVYEHITFQTALMPVHGHDDIIEIGYTPLGIADKFSETSWETDLRIGAQMKHTVRKVVPV